MTVMGWKLATLLGGTAVASFSFALWAERASGAAWQTTMAGGGAQAPGARIVVALEAVPEIAPGGRDSPQLEWMVQEHQRLRSGFGGIYSAPLMVRHVHLETAGAAEQPAKH